MKTLFIFAHPDDETFSSGGTILKLTSNKNIVNLICATKGEAGEPGNPPITDKKNIGKVREQELRRAAKILGISKIHFLGLIDGTLHKINAEKLTKLILPIIKKENPDIVVTFDSTGASNHPDHIAISIAATKAFEKFSKLTKKHVRLYHTAIPKSNLTKLEKAGLSYNAFGKVKGVEDETITTKVNINKQFNKKVKALKQHKTQHQDWERFLKRDFVVDLKNEYFTLIKENDIFD